MNKSETIGALAKALSLSQSQIENAAKVAENPAFKRGNKTSTYADLAEVLNCIRPVFSKHGLSFVQFPSFSDDTGLAHVETMLMHESGEWISSVASAPVSKRDAQGVGSAITYLRRYSAAAMAGIAQEDDDGNAATGVKHEKTEPAPSNLTIGDIEYQEINLLIKESGSDEKLFCKHFSIPSIAALSMRDYQKACAMLNAKIKQVNP